MPCQLLSASRNALQDRFPMENPESVLVARVWRNETSLSQFEALSLQRFQYSGFQAVDAYSLFYGRSVA